VTKRLLRTSGALAVAALALGSGAIAAESAGAQPPQVSTSPGLFPTFSSSITDYVTRCSPPNPVQVSINAPAGDMVAIDNGPPQTGAFTQNVNLTPGQEFQIASTESGVTSTYYVRCLPSDFPAFSATRNGSPQAGWYVVAPNLYPAPAGVSWQYVAIFDTNGVPLWWMKSSGKTIPADAKLLPDGDIVWTHAYGFGGAGAEEHQLDGTLVRTINTVGAPLDHHDILMLANGDYLAGTTFTRTGVNMSSCGGSTSGPLKDFALQELTPSGSLVWSWTASAHIAVSEVSQHYQINCRTGGDVYHWNSVALDGSDYVLSFRDLNAVYAVNPSTGALDWKLGGAPEPESLTIVGDPLVNSNPLCAQHDAQVLPDGSITVYDDGTGCNRRPRVTHYTIDTTARTATFVGSLTNPGASFSWCCGSARDLPGGDWVIGWGGTPIITEDTASGSVVFQLNFTQKLSSYRAEPILPGQLTASALRAGMDAMYPGG
jgi:outer membrane protein assembly factor BamB